VEMFDAERDKAKAGLASRGLDPDAFTFERTYLPPESDDGAMFTVRYEVRIVHAGKAMTAVGGIGLDWVGDFEDALDEGRFS
jgi:hypothetical protein